MITNVDLKTDYAFTRTFGVQQNADLLENLIQAVTKAELDPPFANCVIQNPFNPKEAFDEKQSILDVNVHDASGRSANVEMQMVAIRSILPPRLLYYWAGLFRQPLQEGDNYLLLQPVISICFIDDILYPDSNVFHHAFKLTSEQDPKLRFSDHLSIHTIELPKFKKTVEELNDPLDVWCYVFRHGEHLDPENLPGKLNTPPIRRTLEVLSVLNQTPEDRQRYLARRKRLLDEKMLTEGARVDARAEGMKEGKKEGKKEGMKEGLDAGVLVGQILSYQQFLGTQLTPKQRLCEMSLEDLRAMQVDLERRLSQRQP